MIAAEGVGIHVSILGYGRADVRLQIEPVPVQFVPPSTLHPGQRPPATEPIPVQKRSTRMTPDFELGSWLGRRQVMATCAARSTVSDVACLLYIRDHKLYKGV